jgi:DNA-binding GntR family transcriptional regulator
MKSKENLTLSPDKTVLHTRLAAQIIEHIRQMSLEPGAHISAQSVADALGVSRSPVNGAFAVLREKGVLRHEVKRGHFVTDGNCNDVPVDLSQVDELSQTYFRIAEDVLSGDLPAAVSEAALRERYGLKQSDLRVLLSRMQQEGWIERRQGYGWRVTEMLQTPDALEQTYRLRAALEPAALLEPSFRIDPAVISRLVDTERGLLSGEIDIASIDILYARGVTFHETLARASGNQYMLDALRRVNQIRRLIAYRSMVNRERYYRQAEEHLEILFLVQKGAMPEAAVAMRHHLGTVMLNLNEIEPLLRKRQ